MKHIKFIAKDQQQLAFAAAVRKNVYNYFTENGISMKGNLTLYLQTITMLTLYIAPFLLVLTVIANIGIAFLMSVVMGIGMAGIGMCVMHDGAHQSFSEKEWVNKLFASTMYLLGSSLVNWKIQHNVLHHTYTNINGYDQDIESRGPLRLSEQAPIKKFHYYQHLYAFLFYGLMTISKIVRDFSFLKLYHQTGLIKYHKENNDFEYVTMFITKAVYLFIVIALPILITPFTWWQVLLGFLMMHWVAGCILTLIFQMAHLVEGAEQPMPDAAGYIHHDWTVHQLMTTSDFGRDNDLLNWYIGGLNFQIEHHLFPNISHVHYRKIAPIIEKTAKEFGYHYNLKPTFMHAVASHIRRLKALGQAKHAGKTN